MVRVDPIAVLPQYNYEGLSDKIGSEGLADLKVFDADTARMSQQIKTGYLSYFSATGRDLKWMQSTILHDARLKTGQIALDRMKGLAELNLMRNSTEYQNLHNLHEDSKRFTDQSKENLKRLQLLEYAGLTDEYGIPKEGADLVLSELRAQIEGVDDALKSIYEDDKKDKLEHFYRVVLTQPEKFKFSSDPFNAQSYKNAAKNVGKWIAEGTQKPDIISQAFAIEYKKKPDPTYLAILAGNKKVVDAGDPSELKELQKKISRLLILHGTVRGMLTNPADAKFAATILKAYYPNDFTLDAIIDAPSVLEAKDIRALLEAYSKGEGVNPETGELEKLDEGQSAGVRLTELGGANGGPNVFEPQ